MASACVNKIPTTYDWLSPTVSLSSRDEDGDDFEFRLSNNGIMLPADKLISDGKLLPLHSPPESSEDTSPKAPRCSSRWRDLLRLKILNQQSKSPSIDLLPLLKNSSFSCSSSSDFSRLSVDKLPRASVEAEKPISQISGPKVKTKPNPRISPHTRNRYKGVSVSVSVDSPRMNPSGKVVFQCLERSSSTPSSVSNGGSRYNRNRGVIERSYSANVTPVLNVPLCSSLRHLFSSSHSQKKDGITTKTHHHSSTRNKKQDDKEKEKKEKEKE